MLTGSSVRTRSRAAFLSSLKPWLVFTSSLRSHKSVATLNITVPTWDIFSHFSRSLVSGAHWQPCVIPSITSSTGSLGTCTWAHRDATFLSNCLGVATCSLTYTHFKRAISLSSCILCGNCTYTSPSDVSVLNVVPNSSPHLKCSVTSMTLGPIPANVTSQLTLIHWRIAHPGPDCIYD